MSSLKQDVAVFLDDLGPAWIAAATALAAISLLLRTWLFFGIVVGVLLTLYIHPFESSPSHRRHAYSQESLLAKTDPETQNDVKTKELSQDIPVSLRSEMHTFSTKVIRDYVNWWYCPPNFPADQRFPAECESSLNHVLNRLYTGIRRKDPVLYLDAIFTTSVATLGVVLEDLKGSYKLRTESDPVGLSSFAAANPGSALARLLNKHERDANLQRRALEFLRNYALQEDLHCSPVSTFLQQILSVSVFEKSLNKLANRDSLNAAIVANLGDNQQKSAPPPSARTQMAALLVGATNEVIDTVGLVDQAQHERFSEDSIPATNRSNEQPQEELMLIEPTIKTARGRRLSFQTRSASSITEFGVTDDILPERRSSFLKRTGSLLSKSRSRSSSPTKDNKNSDATTISGGHNRPRSKSPFKRGVKSSATSPISNDQVPMRATIFLAELIVSDISEVLPASFYKPISKSALPKYSILISPIKQEGFASSAGIGIFRSILDLVELDNKLRFLAKHGSMEGHELYSLPEWRKLTYASLENEVLLYLTSVTKIKALAELEPFREFCRPDLVSEERQDERVESWALADSGKAIFGTLRRGTELIRPSPLSTPKKDPPKRNSLDGVSGTPNKAPERNSNVLSSTIVETQEAEEPFVAESTKHLASDIEPMSPVRDTQPSGVDLGRVDFQNLVSQSMELLSAFYSLTSKTWTIRKQLLNLLRNLLLSKNSNYSQSFLTWLDSIVFRPVSSADSVAELLHQVNALMFPESYDKPEPLTQEASAALAGEARAVFIQKSMPSAIRNLMGVGPTNEALAILFDALQDHDFSMGLFSILFSEAFKMLMID